jgi:propionyl-CoA carboxylase alpha chain
VTPTIRRLLVANRAEVASRVFRTCRELGIETVAVHSDADAGLPYVREADVAVRLPGSAPAETYLRVDRLVAAARRAGADAVHPGYGFLAENADFARAILDAGLTWIGPTPESIEAMGSKVRAKQLMRAAGVPVLEVADPPGPTDLPLIVKASAGGGGRGMRIVDDLDRLDEEIAVARAEAESAFGDGTVLVEPYLRRARHVEVQVLGCPDGTVVVLGDRDCSVQRRHQKVVEEAPAPGLGSEVRAALHEAARTAALTVGYLGAGTVEFLYDPATTRFFFLEMNTRLQVEHPVTELVLGVDLVALQVAVAEGRSLAPARAPAQARAQTHDPSGHAIEVRLYAEDPAAAYTPQSGTLTTFEIPDGPGLRVDAGYESGSVVSTYYDAMLAKVIVHAESRDQAARTLAGVLARARIHGLTTNRDQLVGVLRDPDFLAGDVSTAFLEQHPPTPARPAGDHAVAAALALAECDRLTRTVQQRIPVAWRNVVSQPQTTRFDLDTVEWWGGRDGYAVDGLAVVAAHPTSVTLERDGVATTYAVSIAGDRVDVDAATGHVALTLLPRFSDPAESVASGSLLAPMPGTVVSVAVEQGQTVVAGAPVLVLEAMKMQHTVRAPGPGTVTRLDVRPGAQVAAGQVLAVVSTGSTDEETE